MHFPLKTKQRVRRDITQLALWTPGTTAFSIDANVINNSDISKRLPTPSGNLQTREYAIVARNDYSVRHIPLYPLLCEKNSFVHKVFDISGRTLSIFFCPSGNN